MLLLEMVQMEAEEAEEETKDPDVSQQSLQRHDTKVRRLTCPSPFVSPHQLSLFTCLCRLACHFLSA